jgi:hypothetical protein
MIRKFTILIIWLLLPLALFSQSHKRTTDILDASFSFGKYQGALSVHYSHLWKLGKKQRISVGVGGHVTSYLGANQYYITAPAELTSGSTSPFIFFKENIDANIDTFLVKSPQVTMLNLSINIHYQLLKRMTAGFNIDAIGFSFGKQTQGNYINGVDGKTEQASPTSFNALLISDNDRGSLNSEFFLSYKLNDKWSVKGGAQFLFTEYTTKTNVQQFPKENDRFRNKSLLLAIGAIYKIK